MTIGELIRNARIKQGISQKELAERLSTTPQNINQYENNRRTPKIDTLRKICAAMNITIGELGDDVWEFYSSQEFAEDLKAAINTAISKIPVQMDARMKQGAQKTIENIHLAGEHAQQHAHEIVDSDWRCIFLLSDYDKLNNMGRSEAQKRINELTEIKKYTEQEEK